MVKTAWMIWIQNGDMFAKIETLHGTIWNDTSVVGFDVAGQLDYIRITMGILRNGKKKTNEQTDKQKST